MEGEDAGQPVVGIENMQVGGILLVPIQQLAVESSPHAVDALDPVGDDNVGVALCPNNAYFGV